jgi:glycosyltransferase involved in cell wall biosynthesis
MAKPKVLVFAETLWPSGGGAELATHLFIDSLIHHGYTATIVTGQQPVRSQKGATVLVNRALKANSKTELWIKILSHGATFENVIRDHEVVYIPRFCYPIAPVAKRLGKKVLIHLHDYLPISYTAAVPAPYEQTSDYLGRVKAFNLWLERRKGRSAQSLAIFGNLHTRLARYWLSYADHLICVSDRQMQIISALAPELGGLLSRVYNPLPHMPQGLDRSRCEPLFLYVGGDAYHKGFHVFVKAAIQLLSHGANVKFLMAGNTNHRSDSLFRYAPPRFSGAFEALGRLPYSQVLEKYSTVRGLIFPSIWEEPLSYAVAESMAAGTIPIASNVGGNSELVRGSAAEPYLFEPFRSDSLARNIETILSLSEGELLSIGENLRSSISNTLRAEETTERFVRFFEN